MELKDIDYFSKIEQHNPAVFNLATKSLLISNKNEQDSIEIQRRLLLLSKSTGNEHLRQCSNFLAEVISYCELFSQGKDPHWVPESSSPTPDIQFACGDGQMPVEVKHLNSPHDEHEALASGRMWGGSVNPDYNDGIQKKIDEFIVSAKNKFLSHNKRINSKDNDESGVLYIFFSKSIDASITDTIPWQTKMEDRVRAIAELTIGDKIDLIVRDIDKSFIE
ncbi:MAG: hypothetical protein WCP11_03070 [Candidatus Saccharibacteria bacterium]